MTYRPRRELADPPGLRAAEIALHVHRVGVGEEVAVLCRGPGGALVVQRLEVLGERGVLDGEAERLAVRVDVVHDLPAATAAKRRQGKDLDVDLRSRERVVELSDCLLYTSPSPRD